ncbi:MAG: HD domain-containing protein [Armatimonadetes bacterium]|nr:HD domain-containing protein [Armatimonadota bacterium]
MSSTISSINVPAKGNEKLAKFMERVNENEELVQLWKCANINAVDRSGMSDHGRVHVQIVANAAYKILRLLVDGGITPSVVTNYGLDMDDAGVIVVGGALLHDVGMAVQRENHEIYGIHVARDILKSVLAPLYNTTAQTIIASEIMHCIIAHQMEEVCLTIEAGAVKVADALDMTQGRSRIPFESGQVNIHSVSALAIENVDLSAGEKKPVRVEIRMNNYAGVFQLDELLKPKLLNSSIAPYVEISASISGEAGKDLGVVYSL